jgi:hypothetical protein
VRALIVLALLTKTAAAGPALPAPWNRLDLTASEERILKSLGARVDEEGCGGMDRVGAACIEVVAEGALRRVDAYFPSMNDARKAITDRLGPPMRAMTGDDSSDRIELWDTGTGTRRLLVSLQRHGNEGRVILEPLQPLASLHGAGGMRWLVGASRKAIVKRGGAYVGCGDGKLLCFVKLPPTEAGDVQLSIEFENDVAIKVFYVQWCEARCVGSKELAAYERAFGRSSTGTIPGHEDAYDRLRFARLPGVVLDISKSRTDVAIVCAGRCDE